MLSAEAFRKPLIWLSLFSISMGYLESSVVVYLREISYPAGFDFPLVPIEKGLGITEILREASTLIMLLAAGYMGGRNTVERFAWFLYCFALWDIFYYLFLKMLIGWPQSLFTWDILFLIPVAWTGPVIAPLITSLTMLLLAFILLYFSVRQEKPLQIRPPEWAFLIAGSLVMILAFIWDYCSYVLHALRTMGGTFEMAHNQFIYQYIPDRFNWLLFAVAEIILFAGLFLIWKQYHGLRD